MNVPVDAIADLEREVQRALTSGDESSLDVLGYGEISLIVGIDTADGRFACKRLPPFPGQASFDRYADVFHDYCDVLQHAGVRVLPSELVAVPGGPGVTAYCVQPALEARSLGPNVARGPDADRFIDKVVTAVATVVGGPVGLDAQVSNWAVVNRKLTYIDVTTPLLRDAAGAERLDTDLFVASLPWSVRATVRRFMLEEILDTYYDLRSVLLDFAGNLLKEDLDQMVPRAVAAANEHVGAPLTVDEVHRHYVGDARKWNTLQRLRRLDRAWQRGVRRRPYPFLLPREIQR